MMIYSLVYSTSVFNGKTVGAGSGGCCSGIDGGGIIASGSLFVEAGTNIFFGSGFFGVTGTHSFSGETIISSHKYISQ